jgi:hypothetical protein
MWPQRVINVMQPPRPPPTEDEPSGVPLPDPVTPVEEPPETAPPPKSPPKAPPDPIVAVLTAGDPDWQWSDDCLLPREADNDNIQAAF